MVRIERVGAANPNDVLSKIPELDKYIDVNDALKRVRGNTKIFKTLLQTFAKNLQIEALTDQINIGDFENAAKSAHSIKGSSSNLSLLAVQAAATQLENELKAGSCKKETLDECIAALNKTTQLISEVNAAL